MVPVKVKECGEPLVDVKKAVSRIIVQLNSGNLGREKTAYLRKTVAQMLYEAACRLPPDMTFVVRDAWRSQAEQRANRRQLFVMFSRLHPAWSEKRVRIEVGKYAAPFRGRCVSGHMTGGAVDIRLWRDGQKVPMRSAELSYQENAQSHQPKLPNYLRRNREIMFQALSSVGFSNDPREFWHWSYGDIWWARRMGRETAIYGVVNGTEPTQLSRY